MAVRRCTTQPGIGACCRAAQQGLLNRPMRIQTANGTERCAVCSTHPSTSRDPRKAGRPVFQFRWQKNNLCGIGPSGCPYLGGQQGTQQNQLTFQP